MSFQENVLSKAYTEAEIIALPLDSIAIDNMGLAWQLLETTQGHAWISTMPGRPHFLTSDSAEFVRRRGPFLIAPAVPQEDEE